MTAIKLRRTVGHRARFRDFSRIEMVACNTKPRSLAGVMKRYPKVRSL
jgi:hypothetical protein